MAFKIFICICIFGLLIVSLQVESRQEVSTSSTLRDAINYCNEGLDYEIFFTDNIYLLENLPPITGDYSIDGNFKFLDGNSAYRGLVVIDASPTIKNLTIHNTITIGGHGGHAAMHSGGGGGGGLGAGGGLCIMGGSSPHIENITFRHCTASGGSSFLKPPIDPPQLSPHYPNVSAYYMFDLDEGEVYELNNGIDPTHLRRAPLLQSVRTEQHDYDNAFRHRHFAMSNDAQTYAVYTSSGFQVNNIENPSSHYIPIGTIPGDLTKTTVWYLPKIFCCINDGKAYIASEDDPTKNTEWEVLPTSFICHKDNNDYGFYTTSIGQEILVWRLAVDDVDNNFDPDGNFNPSLRGALCSRFTGDPPNIYGPSCYAICSHSRFLYFISGNKIVLCDTLGSIEAVSMSPLIDGLNEDSAILLSPDERHIFAITGSSVTAFLIDRDTLTFTEMDVIGSLSGNNNPTHTRGVKISEDGQIFSLFSHCKLFLIYDHIAIDDDNLTCTISRSGYRAVSIQPGVIGYLCDLIQDDGGNNIALICGYRPNNESANCFASIIGKPHTIMPTMEYNTNNFNAYGFLRGRPF